MTMCKQIITEKGCAIFKNKWNIGNISVITIKHFTNESNFDIK